MRFALGSLESVKNSIHMNEWRKINVLRKSEGRSVGNRVLLGPIGTAGNEW
jgi:hypothetical protein